MAVTLNGTLFTNRTLYHQTFTSPLVSLVDGTTYYAIVKAANKASPQQFATTSSQPVLVLLSPRTSSLTMLAHCTWPCNILRQHK